MSAACAFGLGTVLLGTGGAGASVMGDLPPFSDPITSPGNACAGDLGKPPNCVLDGSPLIAKFEADDDGNEFSSDFDGGSAETEDNTGTETWTSMASGVEDTVVTGFVARGESNDNA